MGDEVRKSYDVGMAGIHRLLARLGLNRWAHVIIVVPEMERALASVPTLTVSPGCPGHC